MVKQVFRTLPLALVCLGGWVTACSEQAVVSSGQGGSAGTAPASGGSAGAPSPPIVPGTGTGGGGSSTGGAGGASAGGGGTGGAAAIAGSSGSAGAPPYVAPVSTVMCDEPHVGGMAVGIADFDDGLEIAGVDGRGGIWFGYSDGTGKQTDNPIPVVESDLGGKAMHVTGSGFKNWGSGIGSSIAFNFEKSAQCPYDASAFSGVRLKLKGEGSVRLRVTQVATTPATASDRKGSCDPNRAVCDGHHEVTVLLTEDWVEHEFAWTDFKQVFGKLVDFDAKQIIGLSFEFNSGTEYDIWVDDIAFTQSGEGGAGGAGAGGAAAGGENAGGSE
jgi:hypothetical protein